MKQRDNSIKPEDLFYLNGITYFTRSGAMKRINIGSTKLCKISKNGEITFIDHFGSILIRNGVNIKVVQTLMRHENISLTLDIYGHIMDSDPKEAVDKVFC